MTARAAEIRSRSAASIGGGAAPRATASSCSSEGIAVGCCQACGSNAGRSVQRTGLVLGLAAQDAAPDDLAPLRAARDLSHARGARLEVVLRTAELDTAVVADQ